MNAVTVTFLLIGGIGVALLAVSLFVGDVLHFGHPTRTARSRCPRSPVSWAPSGSVVRSSPRSPAADCCPLWSVWSPAWRRRPGRFGTMALARAAGRMRTDATPTRADLIGRMGVIVTADPVQGYGEVRVSIGGQPVKLNARSDKPVALGARVFVIEAPSDTSVVVEETSPV
jgi:hypothetical protein